MGPSWQQSHQGPKEMTRYQHHSAANSNCFSLCKQFIKNCYTYPGVKQTSTLFAGIHQHHKPANKLPAPSRTSGLLPFKLGSANTGPMGPSNSGWLPTGANLHPLLSKGTSSNKVPTREHGSDHHRGDRVDKQRGNRRDISHPTELCLSDFSGGEKGWGPEACDSNLLLSLVEPFCLFPNLFTLLTESLLACFLTCLLCSLKVFLFASPNHLRK